MMNFAQNGMNGMPFPNMGPPFMGGMGGAMNSMGYMSGNPMQSGMDMSGMHNPGAVRKGGHRFNNRSGPYERRGGGMRNGFMAASGGGGSGGGSVGGNGFAGHGMGGGGFGGGPGGMRSHHSGGHAGGGGAGSMGFLAQGGGGGGGKWGDGAGGSMMPREAVQGRSIKSYEDLDAQPSQGGAAGTGAAGVAAGAGGVLDY